MAGPVGPLVVEYERNIVLPLSSTSAPITTAMMTSPLPNNQRSTTAASTASTARPFQLRNTLGTSLSPSARRCRGSSASLTDSRPTQREGRTIRAVASTASCATICGRRGSGGLLLDHHALEDLLLVRGSAQGLEPVARPTKFSTVSGAVSLKSWTRISPREVTSVA